MTSIYSVYDKVASVLAQLDPDAILSLRASDEVQSRFNDLVDREREGLLTELEKDELDHFIVLERLFRLSKIKASVSRA